MKKWFLSVLVIGLMACAPPEPKLDEVAMHQAQQTFLNNVEATIPKLDDGISDARSIALAVTDTCYSSYKAMWDPVAATIKTKQGRMYLWNKVNDPNEKISASLPLVLRYRKNKSQ